MLLLIYYSVVIIFRAGAASSNESGAGCFSFESDLTISCLKPWKKRNTVARSQTRIGLRAASPILPRFIAERRRGPDILW